jgi:hypothetical protein
MTVMPVVPVTVMPMVPVVVMPVYLHGLDMIDLVLRHDGALNVCRRRQSRRFGRNRRYGSGLRACGKHSHTQYQSSTEIQKVPAFHNLSPFLKSEKDKQSRRLKMNVR